MNSSRNSFGLKLMCRLNMGMVSIVFKVIWNSGSGSLKGVSCVIMLEMVMVSSRIRMVKMIFMR